MPPRCRLLTKGRCLANCTLASLRTDEGLIQTTNTVKEWSVLSIGFSHISNLRASETGLQHLTGFQTSLPIVQNSFLFFHGSFGYFIYHFIPLLFWAHYACPAKNFFWEMNTKCLKTKFEKWPKDKSNHTIISLLKILERPMAIKPYGIQPFHSPAQSYSTPSLRSSPKGPPGWSQIP